MSVAHDLLDWFKGPKEIEHNYTRLKFKDELIYQSVNRKVNYILGGSLLPTERLNSNWYYSNVSFTSNTNNITVGTGISTANTWWSYEELVVSAVTGSAWASKQYKTPVATADQILAAKKREAERKRKITRAKNKARVLLLMHLDIQQTIDFEKYGYFFVEGSEGNLYQIRQGRSHNVRLMNPATMAPMYTLCAHPIEAVPDCDTMLAQKLWIENDEPAFVKIANYGTPMAADLVVSDLMNIETRPHNRLALAA